MTAFSRLEALITPSLEAMGYELVRVMMQGKSRPTLQVMAERKDERPMTVEDCADISRSLSAILDVEDPIEGAYTLEVSSPGIDRPLTRVKDFCRWAGYEVKIETQLAIDGRKRFKGRLDGMDEGEVLIEAENGPVRIAFDDVKSARLVLTDVLIAAALKNDQEGQG